MFCECRSSSEIKNKQLLCECVSHTLQITAPLLPSKAFNDQCFYFGVIITLNETSSNRLRTARTCLTADDERPSKRTRVKERSAFLTQLYEPLLGVRIGRTRGTYAKELAPPRLGISSQGDSSPKSLRTPLGGDLHLIKKFVKRQQSPNSRRHV